MPAQRKKMEVTAESDMTPMIDMTFQLIAFFMVLLNFGEGEQDARIRLPTSELAKPPEEALESPITLQLTERGTVYFVGDEVPVNGMGPYLMREKQVMERFKKNPADATCIIRADRRAKAGLVQELIKVCQESGFEKFALRVLSKRVP